MLPRLPRYVVSFFAHSLAMLMRLFDLLQIPENVSFEEAATLPTAVCTAALGFYGKRTSEHSYQRGGAALVAPWTEGGKGKYQDEPIVVTGGASSVGQLGQDAVSLLLQILSELTVENYPQPSSSQSSPDSTLSSPPPLLTTKHTVKPPERPMLLTIAPHHTPSLSPWLHPSHQSPSK